jgi:hypothetical protein
MQGGQQLETCPFLLPLPRPVVAKRYSRSTRPTAAWSHRRRARCGRVFRLSIAPLHALKSRLKSGFLQLSKGPSRDPQPRETSQTQPYLILSRLSRPRIAALCLAARRYGRPLLHAGGAAIAASEGRPPAGNAGMLQGRFRGLRPRGDGAKMAFVLPIRLLFRTRHQGN